MHTAWTVVVLSCCFMGLACGAGNDANERQPNGGSDGVGGADHTGVTTGSGQSGNGVANTGGGPGSNAGGSAQSGGSVVDASAPNTGGSAGAGGTKVDAGAITPYVPAWPCLVPTWPTPTGTPVSISGTRTVAAGATYDGKMALHNGTGSGDFSKDCSAIGTGAQGTTNPLFLLEDGATIQNVIIGNHVADGIHCKGTCTVKNVWFQYVCDDAVTALSGSTGTVTIDGGGGKNAHDKLFQDNSHGKFVIRNFYGEKLGKMYRACGSGGACGSTKGNVTLTNVTAVGVDQIVGVTKGRDTATFSKVCTYQTPTVCDMYDGSDQSIGDGPDGTTCIYKWTDVQVMVDRTAGVFATASECPNYLTSGSSTNPATACIADLPSCVNGCAPGDYGLKMCDCTGAGNTYHCHKCAGPSQDPAKSGLDPVKAAAAPACAGTVKGSACATEWAICKSGTQYCACVYKPGTLQTAATVWDCVNQWW